LHIPSFAVRRYLKISKESDSVVSKREFHEMKLAKRKGTAYQKHVKRLPCPKMRPQKYSANTEGRRAERML